MNNDSKLHLRALEMIYLPAPYVLSLYGWSLDKQRCFAHAGGTTRQDFGGHQCGNKPHFKFHGLQFCKTHAKRIDPSFSIFISVEGEKGSFKISEMKYDNLVKRLREETK